MAKYKNGINGPFSGKIGHVVGVSWRGVDYMRSLPCKSAKKPSAKQLAQRRILSKVSNWLGPLRALIIVGYQFVAGTSTPMNCAISFVLKEALILINGEKEIDYPKVVFSRGDLLISIIKDILLLVNAVLHIKWDNAALSAFNKEDDTATFVLYSPVKEQFVTFDKVANRGGGEVTLQLPADFSNHEVHAWMHYVSSDGKAMSTTLYMGKFTVRI